MRTILRSKLSRVSVALCQFIFLSGLCFAQSDLTTVTGTITDPSRAVIAGATVTIQQANKATRQAVTDKGGRYVISRVGAGPVELVVEAPGFKRYEQSGTVLQVTIAATLNATLTLGQASETILVTSEAAPVQADSPTLGRDITTMQIRDIPLKWP
jgi:hypothetical protein